MADQIDRSEHVTLVYDGGLASQGKIHLYEYGRALYGFSRLVAVMEHYRRSGRVAKRITQEANVDIVVSAPEKGSFLVDALIMTASIVIPELKNVPFEAFLSYLLELILPKSEKKEEMVVELARIRLAEDKERTKQSAQETQRMRILANVVKDQSASTQQALELVKWAMESKNAAIGRAEIGSSELRELEGDYSQREERERLIGAHREALQSIPSDDLRKLTTRARPLIAEIGLPLRKSAKQVSLKAGSVKSKKLISLGEDQVKEMNDRRIESELIALHGKIKAYDRESGWGKLRLSDGGGIIPFFVDESLRRKLVPKIAEAYNGNERLVTAYSVKNLSDETVSLLLESIE